MDAGLNPADYYRLLRTRFEKLSMRERSTAAVILFAVTILIPLEFHWTSMLEESVKLDRQSKTLAKQVRILERTNQDLEERVRRDPNEALRLRNRQLKKQLAEQEARLSSLVNSMVKPEDMPELLRHVLKDQNGIKVRRFRNLPPKQIYTAGIEPADAKPQSAKEVQPVYSRLFSHKVQIEFEAGFPATVEYLHHLESVEAGLLFERLEYKVIEHPKAKVLLSVETIGYEEEWLGV